MYKYISLLMLAPALLATPAMKKNATKEEKEFYKRGQEHMKKVVAHCQKKEFDEDEYTKLVRDPSMLDIFEALAADKNSAMHKQAFKNYQCYVCGMRNALNKYRPQRRSPQDAVITYNKKRFDFALKAPDWATIMEHSIKQEQEYLKRVQQLRWELLAELA